MRDAKADAMQEIRDRSHTKDKKRVVMDVSFISDILFFECFIYVFNVIPLNLCIEKAVPCISDT